MPVTDPIADMLARIRNGLMAGKSVVKTPTSKLRARVLDVLQKEGYIRGYSQTDYDGGKSEIDIELKYFEGEPVIHNIKKVSTPGRRVYSLVGDLPRPQNGLGISIVSTPRGVMSDSEARAANVGGEVLCTVF